MEQAVKKKDGWKCRLAAVGGQLKTSRAFSMFLITSYTDGGHENFTHGLSFEPRNSLLWSNRANHWCVRKRRWIMWTLSRLSEEAFQGLIKSCAQSGWLRISLLFFVELFLSAYILENQDCIQDWCIRWLQRQSVDFWSVHRRVTVNWDHKADPLLFHWTRCTLNFLELAEFQISASMNMLYSVLGTANVLRVAFVCFWY